MCLCVEYTLESETPMMEESLIHCTRVALEKPPILHETRAISPSVATVLFGDARILGFGATTERGREGELLYNLNFLSG